MRMILSYAGLLGTVAGSALVAAPALAQTPAATPNAIPTTTAPANATTTQTDAAQSGQSDIVVTARRRNELLIDVPIAVTAFTGDQLARQGALDITDIGLVTSRVAAS